MKKTLAALCPLLLAVSVFGLIPTRTVEVEVSEATSYPLSVMQGETYEWRFRYLQDGSTLALTGADAATMTWTAYGTAYATTGTVHSATGGVASVVWQSGNATPKGSYQYVVAVTSNTAVLARARGTLTVSQGVADGGSIPVWSGATKADVTNIVEDAIADIPGQTEADPVATPIATNALAQAQAAKATADAALTAGGGTNVALGVVGAFATTGTVSRAVMADMLRNANGRAWIEFGAGGALYVYQVTNTVDVYVAATNGTANYNGPVVGTRWSNPELSGEDSWTYGISDGWYFGLAGVLGGMTIQAASVQSEALDKQWGLPSPNTMPAKIDAEIGGFGTLTIDWVPATNVYQVATEPTVITISQNAVDAHNSETNTAAHPTLARKEELAGYVATTHTGDVTVVGTVTATAFAGDASAMTGLQKSYMYMGATNYMELSTGTVYGYQVSESFAWTVNRTAGVATNSVDGIYLITASAMPTGATAIKFIVVQTNGVSTMLSAGDYAAQRGTSVTGILRLPAGTAVSLYSYPATSGGYYERHLTAVQLP